MIIYGSEVEAEVNALQASISQIIRGTLVDVTLGLYLTIIRKPIHLIRGDSNHDN